MRHHNKNRKLGRERNQRRALLRSLARSILLKKSIKTTEARAKELRAFVEKLVTRAKAPTLANRRYLLSQFANDPKILRKAELIAADYKERKGGYLRIVKIAPRKGDGSPMAVIAFV